MSSPFGSSSITRLRIKAISKIAAPYKDPNGIKAVSSDELEPATMAVTISGAPFANARKVIPANASETSASMIEYARYG